MTPQSTFMILAPVADGQRAALELLLNSMNEAPGHANPRNSLVPFYQFNTLHVARFVLLEANTNDDIRAHGEEPGYWPLTLAFVGDVDGAVERVFAELAIRANDGLREIFAHCGGFDRHKTDLRRWMQRRNQRPHANYVNWRGRTVRQIREELALVTALRARLRELTSNNELLASAGNGSNAIELRQRLIEHVEQEIAACRLYLTPPAPTPPGWMLANVAHLFGVGLSLLLFTPLFLLVSPLYFYWLRRLESSDPENTLRPSRDHLGRLTSGEDFDVTNQFNVFGQVKPGRFRRYTLRFLLVVLNYAAHHVYRTGFLTRIQTIHFARWVLLDNDTRVFFASNYDGSADSYMDDFINKVAWGLNLVFSNGVGYPRTRWLIKGGADFEQKYKHTLRRNQLPSACWYKAYPGLTAVDLARHSTIRQGVEAGEMNETNARTWLALL